MNQNVTKSDNTIIPISELKVGDTLLGINGNPVKVRKIEKRKQDLYEIVQKQGNSFKVALDHVLVLKFTNVEGIYWNDKRKQYKARYILDLKIRDCIYYFSEE